MEAAKDSWTQQPAHWAEVVLRGGQNQGARMTVAAAAAAVTEAEVLQTVEAKDALQRC